MAMAFEEENSMANSVGGIVKDGLVVPHSPLPEGAHVEIRVLDGALAVPPDLQEELEAWQRAGAEALELVERLARESEANEKR
jgi:hypothetical protein